jgi:hypothetical protein
MTTTHGTTKKVDVFFLVLSFAVFTSGLKFCVQPLPGVFFPRRLERLHYGKPQDKGSAVLPPYDPGID